MDAFGLQKLRQLYQHLVLIMDMNILILHQHIITCANKTQELSPCSLAPGFSFLSSVSRQLHQVITYQLQALRGLHELLQLLPQGLESLMVNPGTDIEIKISTVYMQAFPENILVLGLEKYIKCSLFFCSINIKTEHVPWQ